MAKGKKKKKDKTDRKDKKAGAGGTLKALTQNPLVADVVAAALVATAAALKDSKRARALASEAGDELASLSKAGTKSGEALWDMALQIGRRSLEAMAGADATAKRSKAEAKAKPGGAKKSGGKNGKSSKDDARKRPLPAAADR